MDYSFRKKKETAPKTPSWLDQVAVISSTFLSQKQHGNENTAMLAEEETIFKNKKDQIVFFKLK